MSAHYPARPDCTDADRVANMLPPVNIDGDANQVTIGDVALPGQWIQQGCIAIHPGGDDGINTLTVSFLVGSIDVTDSALTQVSVTP